MKNIREYFPYIFLIGLLIIQYSCNNQDDIDKNEKSQDNYSLNDKSIEQELIPSSINKDDRLQLIDIARDSIKADLEQEEIPVKYNNNFKDLKRGVFVTLKKNDELRGCIGSIYPYSNVVNAVVDMSKSAAFEDPRFPPIKPDEFNELEIEISILSYPEKMDKWNDFKLGEEGVIIEYKSYSGVLLPQVVENRDDWTKSKFLSIISQKAGLGPDGWYRYPVVFKKFKCEMIR
jgi:AmmeMemoRadiSam system protein A